MAHGMGRLVAPVAVGVPDARRNDDRLTGPGGGPLQQIMPVRSPPNDVQIERATLAGCRLTVARRQQLDDRLPVVLEDE